MSNLTLNPQGKTAFISGANRGIGRAIAEELLERGAAKVYAGARRLESLEELTAKYGDRIVPVALDVTNDDSIKAATEKINDIDILVNNAGVLSGGGILSPNAVESLQQNLDVNVWGLVNLSNALANQLKKEQPTAIVNISSLAGLGNMPMIGTYSVSKAAVHSLTQGMRAELADHNTLVVGVYPGAIDTKMTAEMEMDKDTPQNVAKNIVNALEAGKEDVFPDAMSEQVENFYASNPKGVEQQFATFVG
ncbi:MAG: SDR family oxidoreductase [Saprospiraceae bacterium]